MKKITKILFLIFTCCSIIAISQNNRQSLSKSYSVIQGGENYKVIELSRAGKRINAKYFAFEKAGKSIAQRYQEFLKNHEVILYSSGTYMTNHSAQFAKPVGLNIDDGDEVNGQLTNMDGLVIVYATGGIAISNLEDGNLNYGGYKNQDLNDGIQLKRFKSWAQTAHATVFQTHLLAWDDELQFKLNKQQYANTSAGKERRERRFLAICYKNKGKPNQEVIHCIVHKGDKSKGENLYDATEKVLNFLNIRKRYSVQAILNLDPGSQDVFQYYRPDNSKDPIIKGPTPISNARNLLVYYFE